MQYIYLNSTGTYVVTRYTVTTYPSPEKKIVCELPVIQYAKIFSDPDPNLKKNKKPDLGPAWWSSNVIFFLPLYDDYFLFLRFLTHKKSEAGLS